MRKLSRVVSMVLAIIGQILLIGAGAAAAVKEGRPDYVIYAVLVLLIAGMFNVLAIRHWRSRR